MITSGGIGVRWEGRYSHQYSATIHIKSSSADTLWDASANNRLHEKNNFVSRRDPLACRIADTRVPLTVHSSRERWKEPRRHLRREFFKHAHMPRAVTIAEMDSP
jgi:hypothetical protein